MKRLVSIAACLAFLYPAWWVSQFLVRALPSLLKVWLLGEHLAVFGITATSVWARSYPVTEFGGPPGRMNPQPLILVAPLVMIAAVGAIRLLRRQPVLAGLFVACLGFTAGVGPLMRWVALSRAPMDARAGAVLYTCLFFFGMWWMVRGRIDPAAWSPQRLAIAGIAASALTLAATHAGDMAREQQKTAARHAVMAAAPPANPTAPYPRLFFQRGVNFTAEGPVGYAPHTALRMLDRLKDHGVNAIALVPYGFSPRDQPVIHFRSGWEREEDMEAITRLAHQRGMKVMLKPQIWLHGAYPAAVHFSQPADRARWFAAYRPFLEFYAGLAAKMHADIFCVGVEFAQMTQYEDEWRSLIARARELYPGPLTYGATQGPEFETIRFWDALDYIGLNNYYPLPDDLATGSILRRVETVQKRFGKPVIFPEAGFSSYSEPHRAPWDETPRQLSPDDQARCYEAVLKAFYQKPWFQGVYWWKVGTDGYGGPRDGSHTPWGKPAMDVVAHWYRQGGR